MSFTELVLLDLKGTDDNPVVQGKLISHLSTNLTTPASSSHPNNSSLALTPLPSIDCSRSVNNYSVNNYSVNNDSVNDDSVNNYTINNASVSRSELYSPPVSLYRNMSPYTTSSEVTTPIMAIPTTIIPGTHLERRQSIPRIPSTLANSSSSSLESTCSSYHTREADKQVHRIMPLVAALESQPSWHYLSNIAGGLSSDTYGDVEGIVQQHSGLTKDDFVAIQERLLFAAKSNEEISKAQRMKSLRRRWPSASQTVSRIQLSIMSDRLNNV